MLTNPNGGRNLKSIKVDGKKIDGYFIPHDLFVKGGKVEVETKK